MSVSFPTWPSGVSPYPEPLKVHHKTKQPYLEVSNFVQQLLVHLDEAYFAFVGTVGRVNILLCDHIKVPVM